MISILLPFFTLVGKTFLSNVADVLVRQRIFLLLHSTPSGLQMSTMAIYYSEMDRWNTPILLLYIVDLNTIFIFICLLANGRFWAPI